MRVSADRDDPDFIGESRFGTVFVSLDGAQIDEAIAADDQAGEVVVCKRDEAGNFLLNEAGDEIERETLRGVVVISTVN